MTFFWHNYGDHVILVLHGLTAAFDTVDHSILMSNLQYQVGTGSTDLEWLRSYPPDTAFSVKIVGFA